MAKYDHLSQKGDFTHAMGRIPDGATVKFSDGGLGTVITGNSQRSLVEHGAGGGMWERAWYDNAILRVGHPDQENGVNSFPPESMP